MRVKKSFLGMILTLAVVALILMAVTAGLATHAEYDGYHDGLYYNDYEDGVQIVRIDKTGRVVIPEYIDGKPVRSVAAIDYDANRYYYRSLHTGFVFDAPDKVTSVTLPDTLREIGDYVFLGCKRLASVTIPDGVTKIGRAAFRDCTSLVTVKMPDTVRSIEQEAFYNCDLLSDIELPAGLTSIGSTAFHECAALKNITIPSGIKSIEGETFCGCAGLTSITIPSSVTSIGNGAFYGCSGLTSITIPNSVTSIGGGAFSRCRALSSIIIPLSVTSIGSNAFNECSSLTIYAEAASRPNGWVYEGNYSNDDSWNPDDRPVVWGYNTVSNGIAYYEVSTPTGTGLGVAHVDLTGNISIPSRVNGMPVVSIGYGDDSVFADPAAISSVSLPSTLTEIAADAFRNCSSLRSITIPSGVKSIGDSAFYGCSSLASVTMSGGVTSIGARAFYDCSALTSVELSDELTSIGRSAFSGCSALAAINIPISVTSIADDAFEDCSSLTIYAEATSRPDGWVYEGNYSYDDNWNPDNRPVMWGQSYSGCLLYKKVDDGVEIVRCDYTGDVVIPSTIEGEPVVALSPTSSSVFESPSQVTSVTLPASLKRASEGVFYGCTELSSVTMPVVGGEVSRFVDLFRSYSVNVPQGLTVDVIGTSPIPDATSASEGYFAGSGIEEVSIAGSVGAIGSYAFSGCTSLSTLTLQSGVTSIGTSAFEGCTSLTSLTVPSSVTSMRNNAFKGCTGLSGVRITSIAAWCGIDFESELANPLTEVHKLYNYGRLVTDLTIPSSVRSIGAYAFAGCTPLTSVTIPDTVTSIAPTAFSGCTAIEKATMPVALMSAVPKEALSTMVLTSGTSLASNAFDGYDALVSVTLPDTMTSIGSSVFAGCTSLEEIILPATLATIGSRAFEDCTGLVSIAIPDSVTTIGQYAFSGCPAEIIWGDAPSLTSFGGYVFAEYAGTAIAVPHGVRSIAGYAFNNCAALTSVTIPDSATRISSSAFSGCSGLTSVTIPDSVMSIGSSAFSGCSNLTEVHITDLAAWCGIEFGGSSANPLSFAHTLYLNRELVTDLIIPAGVEFIGDYVFAGCSGLTSVFVPDEVTSIGVGAFNGCDALETMTLPFIGASRDAEYYNAVFGYIFGYDTYSTWDSTSGTLSDSFINTKLGEVDDAIWQYTCRNYSHNKRYGRRSYYYFIPLSLRKVVITDAYYVSTAAFNGCSMLSEITLNHGIAEIYDYAFYNCVNLTTVNIPAGVTAIGDHAFSGCSALPSIELPSSIINIGDNVFDYCESLGTITVDEGSLNYHSAGNCLIKTSDKILLAGGNAAVIPSDGSVTSIAAYAFSGRSGLVSVTIPSGVKKIGEYAFADCGALVSIMLPDSVTSLGSGLLSGCSSLETITLPFIGNKAGITSGSEHQYPLGYIFGKDYYAGGAGTKQTYKFGSSTATQTYYIPRSLRSVIVTGGEILQGAFYNCSMLTTVTIPESVTSIGREAFYNCKNLSEVSFKGTMAEWDEVSKGVDWNSSCPFAVVKCSDGDVAVR